ncbi:MAG: fasciclin domain-containing protein [Methanomicrobiaceae archaeon]|nr:fasciclin domain-containing protein [Methanomicrobiaceae archaeon]
MKNIIETLKESEGFATFLDLVRIANMEENLAREGPFTVFAPTDEAFARVQRERMDELRQDPDTLELLLAYHIVPGMLSSTELRQLSAVQTLLGTMLTVRSSSLGISINNVRIVEADAFCTNGICHALDAALIPPDIPVIVT